MTSATYSLEQQEPPPPPIMHTPPAPDAAWNEGWLAWLRTPRLWYAIAAIVTGLVLWVQYNPVFGDPGRGPRDGAPDYAHAHFLNAEGAFALDWGQQQRWIVYVAVVALLLLVACFMRMGSRRGGWALAGVLLAALSFAVAPTHITTLAMWVGGALIAGALAVRASQRSRLGTAACAAGVALLLVTYFFPAVSATGDATYESAATQVYTSFSDSVEEGAKPGPGEWLRDNIPLLTTCLLLLLGLIHLLGAKARWVADSAMLFLVTGVVAHMTAQALGGAHGEALDGWQDVLRGLTQRVPMDPALFMPALAAALAELTGGVRS